VVWHCSRYIHVLAWQQEEAAIISHRPYLSPHVLAYVGGTPEEDCWFIGAIYMTLCDDNKLVVVSDSHYDKCFSFIYIMDMFTGEILWQRTVQDSQQAWFASMPCVVNNTLYFAASDEMGEIALVEWKKEGGKEVFQQSVLSKFHAFADDDNDYRSSAINLTNDGHLFVCINAEDGPILHCIEIAGAATKQLLHGRASENRPERNRGKGGGSLRVRNYSEQLPDGLEFEVPLYTQFIHDGFCYLPMMVCNTGEYLFSIWSLCSAPE